MLCITLQNYSRPCNPVTGGLSDIVTFDPNDYDFTQAAAINGAAQPYSAIALRAGATGTGATPATATVTITAVGADNDVLAIRDRNGALIASVIKTSAETTVTLLAAKLKDAINASTSGYTATNAAGVLTITAPASLGALVNTTNLVVDDGGAIVATKTAFTGGVTGTGGKMYAINFLRDEAEWTWKQSVKGCSVKYEHAFNFQLPENSQNLTTFLQALDAASCCCGLGMAIRLNDNKIFIAGEKYVNGSSIGRFTILNNGSSGGTGKLYDDFNGGNLVLTGPYSRNLYQFSGDWSDIEALLG